jgi:solute carrier family 13 (sodium-dependent dicarboxylate transporter), member 2/3/5
MSVAEQQTASHPVQGSTPSAEHGTFDAVLKAVGVPLAMAVAVAIWLAPTPQNLSIEGHKALALFGGIFVLYLTEAIPLAIASLLIVPAATLTGVTNLKGALEGFSSSSAYLIVGAFILAAEIRTPILGESVSEAIGRRWFKKPVTRARGGRVPAGGGSSSGPARRIIALESSDP